MYMMPKHIFETVEDPVTFTFSEPVVLGNYVPVETDPNGYGSSSNAEKIGNVRRPDHRRQAWSEYVLTIFYDGSAKKAIAMSCGESDVYFDVDIEAFETTLDTTPTARSWYTDFPWAYPNEVSTRHLAFNMDGDPIYANKDVRWALALALDIVDLQNEYIGGVAKVTMVPVPPTASLARSIWIRWRNGSWIWRSTSVTVKCTSRTTRPSPIRLLPGPKSKATRCRVHHATSSVPDGGITIRRPQRSFWSITASAEMAAATGSHPTATMAVSRSSRRPMRMMPSAWPTRQPTCGVISVSTLRYPVWSAVFGTRIGMQVNITSARPGRALHWRRAMAGRNLRGRHSRYYVPVGEDDRSSGGENAERIQDATFDELIDAMAGS